MWEPQETKTKAGVGNDKGIPPSVALDPVNWGRQETTILQQPQKHGEEIFVMAF